MIFVSKSIQPLHLSNSDASSPVGHKHLHGDHAFGPELIDLIEDPEVARLLSDCARYEWSIVPCHDDNDDEDHGEDDDALRGDMAQFVSL